MYTSNVRPPVYTWPWFYGTVDNFIDWLLSAQSPERAYPIVTNHHMGPKHEPDLKFIFFNTEQLTRQSEIQNVLRFIRVAKHIVEIWDYSQVNIDILNSHGVEARLVKLGTSTEYSATLKTYLETQPKAYDIAFSGLCSPRRTAILKNLEDAGLSVNLLKSTYADERNKEIAKCKLLLNIHYNPDYKIFEILRCDPWLSVGFPTITEESLENDERAIVCVYDTLVDTCKTFLSTV